jgi:FkbM family methyltransferase
MQLRAARLQLRTVCRHALQSALRRIPLSWLDRLRITAPGRQPTRQRLRTALLEIARHRGIPSEVATFSPPDRPDLLFVNADSMILQRLYWFGETGYEPGLVEWWRYFCRRSEQILELGANVGYYTVQGAQAAKTSTYVAVEPHPSAARVCEAHIAANRLTNVRLIRAAAVADDAIATLSLTIPRRDHFGIPTGSFLPGSTELAGRPVGGPLPTVTVPGVPITSLLADVDLLKLDVEGQEYELLRAASEQLLVRRPTIFLEILRNTPRLRGLVVDLCTSAGYCCYVPARGTLVRLPLDMIASVDIKGRYDTRDVILAQPALLAG